LLQKLKQLLSKTSVDNNSVPPSPSNIEEESEEVLKKYEQELTKLLLSNTMDYIRTTSQQLQTVTGILLSSYIAIFFGLGKQFGFPPGVNKLVYSIPIIFFASSLILSFIMALFSKVSTSSPGDWESAHFAFFENLKRRQKQMYWPALLSLVGLISFVVVAIIAF
jgi:hypothetical protein